MSKRPIVGKLDIGAYEYVPPASGTLYEQITSLLIQLTQLIDAMAAK